MSYVLEALKKAEAQQDPGARTSLMQEHRDRRRSRWLQILVSAALLGNLVVLLWLFYPRTALILPPTDETPVPGVSKADPDATLAAPEPAAVPSSERIEPPATPLAALVPTADPAAEMPAAAASVPPEVRKPPPVRLHLANLPSASRSRFPGLAFSTHIYAEDPTLRALVVNGNRLTEGDRFGALELVEITEEGAVFGFEDYLVEVSVLDTWD